MTDNYKHLFIDLDDFSREWDEKFCEFANTRNEDGLRTLISDAEYMLVDEYIIKSYIGWKFAKDATRNKLKKLWKQVEKIDGLKVDCNKRNCLKLKCNDFELKAERLTSCIPELKRFDRELLYEEKRMGKCHEKAFNIALGLKGNCEIVSGYIHGYSSISRYFHSWVEVNAKSEVLVIEPMLNAIINKEAYYAIQQAEVVTRIPWETAYKEMKFISETPLRDVLSNKEYFCFRDELMPALRKNSEIFGNPEALKEPNVEA